MRFSTTFLGLLVVSSMLFAQQKVVITSAGDIVPLKKGASSIDAARATGLINDRTSSTSSCGNTTSFGFKSNLYPCNLPFVGYHHDVWGQWFVCPSDGSIDSVYISTNDQNEMASGTAKLRIFQSNITPSVGPGHGPYHSPRHSWGYYKKANLSDEDFGATPFKDAATDTHWIPTNFTTDSLIATGVDDGAANPSFDPLGDELWGLGGWPHVFTINSINGIGMLELGYKPDVTKDQSIFLTLEQLGTHTPAGAGGNNAGPATWCMSSQGIPDPSVNWKFYEHSTAGNRGWHARSEASWIWWMVMTVTADIPPDINSLDRLSHTLSTGPRTVYTHLQDCNPGHPDSAGIASATFTYSIDGAAEVTIPMTFDGGDQYHASIPGGSPEDHNYYYITVTDIKGNVTTSAKIKYTIIALRNAYYSLDTAATYNWVELSGDAGANKVASSAFFNPRGTQGPATDDGTAGPVNMGFSFKFFDITDRYAWLGANGGIALSDTTSDTLQINGAGGSFPGNWQFPSSVVPNVDMPKNFIAALCNDYNLAPKSTDAPYAHGYVWWKTDGTKFICEWDSVGVVSKLIPDTLNSFELILDNSDGSITYQYKDISGGVRLDTSALVGLQKDSLDNHWLMVNKENNPPELKPRNGKAFRFSRTVATLTAADGWNLLSVPGSSTNLSKSYIFPTAASAAFRYQAGYIPTDPLDHERGFWVKFNGAQTIFIPGQNQFSVMPSAGGENTVNSTTTIIINVVAGWNMIGSCSAPVATNTIVQSPPGIVVSNYFAYGLTGYFIASTINPGYGYWVKCSGPGTLTLNCVSNVAKTSPVEDPVEGLSALTIQDSKGRSQTLYFGAGVNKSPELFSLPPSAPGEQFDVRFASQRMAELVPTDLKAAVEYAIQLQSVAYPVTITWNVKNSSDVSYDISYRNGKKDMVRRSMLSAGRLQLRQPVEGLKLTAKPGHAEIPLQYALDQNYPNPFNPTTEIRFALPVDAHVTLKVFTITGQVVAELIDGDQEAGFHSITWDSRNISSEQISSGVYFYRLVATDVNNPSNSFDQVKKMMLMK